MMTLSLMTTFGLLAEMMSELNSLFIFMMFGYLQFRRRMRNVRISGGHYDLRSKVTRQLDNMHFLINYNDEMCKDHIRMNSDCFNRLCYLLQNLGGLRSTRNVTISEQVAIFFTILSHHTKNRVVKHTFRRPGYTISKHFNSVLNTLLNLHRVLLVTPVPIPDDNNDYRNSDVNPVGRVRKRSVYNSRRVWTYAEETKLINALQDLVVKGLKCDNGFKSGYLMILENNLTNKFPRTDLKGELHINSKIHVWKK
ncbi:hypothetical protein ACS0TY_035931 [Phlomoides rotata]